MPSLSICPEVRFDGWAFDAAEARALADRIVAGSSVVDECWVWTGYSRNGYGVMSVHDSHAYIHRLVYALVHGSVPPGGLRSADGVVRHTCDVKACWRPDHLVLGSQHDNVHDAIDRGRAATPPPFATGLAHPNARLTEEQVAEIRRRWATGEVRQRELAAEFGCSQSTIGRLVNGMVRA